MCCIFKVVDKVSSGHFYFALQIKIFDLISKLKDKHKQNINMPYFVHIACLFPNLKQFDTFAYIYFFLSF